MIKRKLITAGFVIAMAAMVMSGCKSGGTDKETTAAAAGETAGSQESGTASGETKSEEELTDEASLELGNYKGLTLTAVKAGVTDEDLEAELENLKGQYPAEVTGRAAKLGDVANIDYVGTKDGEAFSGGTAEGFDLALGSGTFIDGFEDGVVGILSIPKMDLELPIYLGATADHLANGAAQLSQTSMPIGGTNTNCVLAGHRGWYGALFFRHIELLEIGDEVSITNLRETLTYQVVEIKVIEPNDIDQILIQPGRDLVTLLTCHPYGSGGRYRYVVYCERNEP